MNEKKQPTSLNGGIHLNKIPYKLNQLPYKPTITITITLAVAVAVAVAVDKLTQNIIAFSTLETPIAQNIQIQRSPDAPQLPLDLYPGHHSWATLFCR